MNYSEFFMMALPLFIKGAVVTIKLSIVALIVGFILGIPLAFLQLYGTKFLKSLATIYIEFMRGTPLMVQLFVFYFGLPQLGIVFSSMTCAFIALGLNSAAYQAEYFRGAIIAVGDRQMVAARSIGMSTIQAIRCIILPQAIRLVLPSWSNEAIYMIKNTAVVYMIAVPDMMAEASKLSTKFYDPIRAYGTVAIFYMLIVAIIAIVFHFIERKTKIPGLALEEIK